MARAIKRSAPTDSDLPKRVCEDNELTTVDKTTVEDSKKKESRKGRRVKRVKTTADPVEFPPQSPFRGFGSITYEYPIPPLEDSTNASSIADIASSKKHVQFGYISKTHIAPFSKCPPQLFMPPLEFSEDEDLYSSEILPAPAIVKPILKKTNYVNQSLKSRAYSKLNLIITKYPTLILTSPDDKDEPAVRKKYSLAVPPVRTLVKNESYQPEVITPRVNYILDESLYVKRPPSTAKRGRGGRGKSSRGTAESRKLVNVASGLASETPLMDSPPSPINRQSNPSLPIDWNPSEILKFEAAIFTHGKQFGLIAEEVGTKSCKDCVGFYYSWKRNSRYKEFKLRNRKKMAEAFAAAQLEAELSA